MEAEFHTVILLFWGVDGLIFVTTGQRIAVENFEQGLIYKVVFTDNTAKYMMCTGIGKDFVMLFEQDLFALTMQTASQISSIDLYDPTPPVPLTNLLQYQTGVPPFEFPTTDTSLFSWYIEGECGDRTENLWDKVTAPSLSLYINTGDMIIRTNADARLTYIPCKANTEYIVLKNSGTRFTIATTATVPNANVSILNYSVDNTGSMLRITTTSTSKYLAVWYWRTADTITEEQMRDSIMIIEGSTAPSTYIPYGYKIPVICNEHTTNIYLDAPLSEGEILYSTDIDTAIVTDIGENELTVGTTQQPTSMQIVYKIADR